MAVSASEDASPPLALRLLGPMQVEVHGRPLPPLRSRKALWVLALLVLRQERPVEREWLAGTLWPDMEPGRGFTNLRVVLSELRRMLGDQSGRLHSPSRHTLSLDLAGAEVDLRVFDSALVGKDSAALQQAVALYRGPLLEGCAEEWVYPERRLREQNCLRALQRLGDGALAAGNAVEAAACYQQAIRLDPWWEAARRGLMEALVQSGDRNAALQVYREFVEVLRGDPKAVPDPETSALYARLRAEASHPIRRPSPIVSEAVAPTIPGYLPNPPTDLIGREEERLEVAACLKRSRLVTLIGPGGMGKTRLAMKVAQEVASDYPDGVWMVSLEALSDGSLLASQVASVLGLRETSGFAWPERLAEDLGQKRSLLILDNCEHLLTASAQFAVALLSACKSVRILATSREALGISGEVTWTLPALAVPDPAHLPQGEATLLRVLAGYESVQLFVERAQAVQKGFALTGSNARTVAQICCGLEGIPLSIELAAVRVRAMTVEQIAVRMDDHLSLLKGGSRMASFRQQTLRATLDWSYALLSEPERVLLHRLSVFVGGWTLEAAEQVCGGEGIEAGQVLHGLTSLVEKSLVVFEERESAKDGRYRLLEIVRQYAEERLQTSGERVRLQTSHRDWFVALAETSGLTEADPQRALQRLEADYDNLRAALTWCEADADGAEAGLRLAGALGRFLYLRGHYTEGRKMLEKALGRDEAQAATLMRARALNGAGVLIAGQGDYAAAQGLLEESLTIYRELTERQSIAVVSGNLGNIYGDLGAYAAAHALYVESLDLLRELGDRMGVARTLNSLGTLASRQGDYASAQTWLTESLQLRKDLGDKRGIAVAGNNLGGVALKRGEYGAARALYEESLRLNSELGDRQGMAVSLNHLGALASRQSDYEAAQALYEESLRLFQELGDKRRAAAVREGMAEAQRAQSEARQAE